MPAIPDTPVRTLVSRTPAAAEVLARHNLDFCCHGDRTLADLCTERRVDLARVTAELEERLAGDPGAAWGNRGTVEVIDHLACHYHVRMRRHRSELTAMVEAAYGNDDTRAVPIRDVLARIFAEAEVHTAREEVVLFPLLLSGRAGACGGLLATLDAEHRAHCRSLDLLHTLTGGFRAIEGDTPEWTALCHRLAAFSGELREHMHLEDHVLFPRLRDTSGA